MSLRAWSKQQGLPDDSVTSVLQTRDGYLWVGTSGGLARFDGMKFTIMSPRNWKSNATISVTALCEDSSSRLWIGTQDNGLLRYEDGALSPFLGDGAVHFQTINSIAEDTSGNLWIGTPTGLVRLTGDQSKRYTKNDGLPNDFISNVHVARSGTLWITTHGGMCRLKDGRIEVVPFQTDSPGRNPESLGVYEDRRGRLWAYGDTYLVNLADGKHLNHFGSGNSTRIWSLCEGQNGELWIGTSGKGLYCFADEKFILAPTLDGELIGDIRAICQDRQGNLWLGTYGDGLVRLQPRPARLLDARVGLPNRPAVCLAFKSQGQGWIGFDRAGLYAGTAAGFEQLPEVLPNLQNLVSSICIGPDSSVWVGTPGAGLYCIATNQRCLHLTTTDGLSDNNILSLAVDSDRAIWVGTAAGLNRITNGVPVSFGLADGLPDEAVTAILADRNTGVWLGFSDGSIFRENRGQFHSLARPSAVSGKAIRALAEDSNERVWIGTEGGRLGCLIGDRFISSDLSSETTEKSILGLVTTDEGDLWIETGRSIYCVGQKGLGGWLSGQGPLRTQLIFRADSVPASSSGHYGWPQAVKSPDGTLWFATESGIVTVNTAGALTDSAPPPVVIEDVLVNGNRLSPALIKRQAGTGKNSDLPVRFPSDLLKFEIHFTALDLSTPEKLRFRYRLEPRDSDWVIDNEGRRETDPGALRYGSYTFRVQAGNGNQWNENEASFRFIVPTPIWRTPWALTLYGIAGFLFAGGIARMVSARRFRRKLAALAAQQAMERERMRIARDMHDEIGSKLTKISFMSERAKRELEGQDPVARKLDSIAGTSRELLQTLDEIVWAVNPHNDTLEHLAAYLGQYATEYLQNTMVECELHIPRGLPHHPLSAEARHNLFLAFEESLNNALKHGCPSRVRVNMQMARAQFEITIEDNGRGFDSAVFGSKPSDNGVAPAQNRNGLRNMRQRLEMLGGHCDIQSRAGHGTTVTLTVPLAPETTAKSNGT